MDAAYWAVQKMQESMTGLKESFHATEAVMEKRAISTAYCSAAENLKRFVPLMSKYARDAVFPKGLGKPDMTIYNYTG